MALLFLVSLCLFGGLLPSLCESFTTIGWITSKEDRIVSSSSRLFARQWEGEDRRGGRRSGRGRHRDSSPRRRTNNDEQSYYLATCIPGLAPVLADEMQDLGCESVQTLGSAAVEFLVHDMEHLLQVLLWTRVAHKLLQPLPSCTGWVKTPNDVSRVVQERVNVEDLLLSKNNNDELLTLSVQVLQVGRQLPERLTHSHFTALTIKNAICDQARNAFEGERPSVDTENPQVPLVAVLQTSTGRRHDDDFAPRNAAARLTLYRQLHVDSLHRRGYRHDSVIHKAAMKESLAAGLLYFSRWPQLIREHLEEEQQSSLTFIDPMAGSGTLLLEAMCIAGDVAPGLMRLRCNSEHHKYPPLLQWSYHAPLCFLGPQQEQIAAYGEVWKRVLQQAASRAKAGLQRLREAVHEQESLAFIVNDAHPGAVRLLENSLEQAGMGLSGLVQEVAQENCQQWFPCISESTSQSVFVVTNPPWGGERLEEDTHMHEAWEELRVFLRDNLFQESPEAEVEAWVLSGNPTATKHLGLRKTASIPLRTGNQQLRWLQYHIQSNKRKLETDPSKRHKKPERRTRFVTSVREDRKGSIRDHLRSQSGPPANSRGQQQPVEDRRRQNLSSQRSSSSSSKAESSGNEWLIEQD